MSKEMVIKDTRRRVRPLLEVFMFSSAVLLTAKCESLQHPTRVPGSDHLIVQTDFPYQYWRPSSRPYTPTVPSVPATTPTSYGFHYGESRNDQVQDASTWQMLPIQLTEDLVGAVNERTTRMTTPAPTYPTAATPQYGRYPGVTESPHLYHPERLYPPFKDQNKNVFQDEASNRPRFPHHQYSSQGNAQVKDQDQDQFQIPRPSSQRPNWPRKPQPQTSWHQTILDQVEPFMSNHLPQIPKFPDLSSINSISRLPSWPFGITQEEEEEEKASKSPLGEDLESVNVGADEGYAPHRIYPIPNPTTQKHRKNKRPNQHFAHGQQTIILSTPSNYEGPHSPEQQHQTASHHFETVNHFSPNNNQNNQGSQNSFFDDPFQYIKKQIRPMNTRKRPNFHRRRPLRRNQFQNRPIHEPEYAQGNGGNDPWDAQLVSGQNQAGEYQHIPNNGPNFPQTNNGRPGNDRFRPGFQGRRPFRRQRPQPNLGFGSDSSYGQNQPHSQEAIEPVDTRRPRPPGPNFAIGQDDGDYDHELIDRLTDSNPLSSEVALPGGMLVVAMALALFYFNFVWYPTPVVTAKLIKLISDSAPNHLLDSEKQEAIGKVYEVFRSLETEYMQDPNLWQPSCKSRLVCQVHQDIPGLWQVTHAYQAVVSLATGPKGDDDLTVFMEAAEEGSQGSNCSHLFKSCHMAPIPVRASLQKLLGIADQQILPTVVYS